MPSVARSPTHSPATSPMAAKTRADLGGLLVDLPPLATTAAVPQQPQRRRRSGALMLVLVAALVFFSAGWWLWPPHVPVFLLLVGFFVLLRHWSWHGRRQHGHWW